MLRTIQRRRIQNHQPHDAKPRSHLSRTRSMGIQRTIRKRTTQTRWNENLPHTRHQRHSAVRTMENSKIHTRLPTPRSHQLIGQYPTNHTAIRQNLQNHERYSTPTHHIRRRLLKPTRTRACWTRQTGIILHGNQIKRSRNPAKLGRRNETKNRRRLRSQNATTQQTWNHQKRLLRIWRLGNIHLRGITRKTRRIACSSHRIAPITPNTNRQKKRRINQKRTPRTRKHHQRSTRLRISSWS